MKKKNFILGIIVGCILTVPIAIYGATTLYDAIEVAYDNTSSGTTKEEVQGAIDELYEMSKTHCPDGYICTQPGAQMLISKANKDNITDYNAGNKGEMYTFHHEATIQTLALTDYRYIGNEPNNYITFNNETWRIIGIFEGRIKIIKDELIGDIAWDSNNNANLVQSTLMKMLNENNGIWKLNDIAKSQIEETIYYLGGERYLQNYKRDGDFFYNSERGNTVYAGRPINWQGKVGLMYPSDYAYTYAYNVDNECYTNLHRCNTSVPSSGWLYSEANQWTLTPTSDGSLVFVASIIGHVGASYAITSNGVRPTVYLRSDIELSGSGTSSDPYLIEN